MFGNTLGWIISAMLSVLAVYGSVTIFNAGQPTSPTGWVDKTVKPFTLEEDAKAYLPAVTDTKADAGALYRDAVEDYYKHQNQYDELPKNQDYGSAEPVAESLKGFDDFLAATHANCIGIFAGDPEKIINSEADPRALHAMDQIGKAMSGMIALQKYDKHFDAATTYSEALLAAGFNLYRERLALVEMTEGETLMSLGNASLMNILEAENAPASKKDAQQKLKECRDALTEKRSDVAKVLNNIDEGMIAEHAGDFFQMATDAKLDRMWRVEAIRKVGRLQFSSLNRADQLKAPRVLREIAGNAREDAIIKLAAKKALNMTESDNQAQR